jgi:hypothetical protein
MLTAPDDRLPGMDNVDVSALRSLSFFPRWQFVLFGAAPQLASFRPDVVCIDYDPAPSVLAVGSNLSKT